MKQITTVQEAIDRLRELQKSGDTELAHGDADSVLCDFLTILGYEHVVHEYNLIDKWYA